MSLKISLKTACCNQSLERGSFYAGIYTLTFYTVLVIIGALHLNLIDEEQDKDYLRESVAICLSYFDYIFKCHFPEEKDKVQLKSSREIESAFNFRDFTFC